MEQHDLIQGTPEWHQHRATHFNASDAPAMLGISQYKSRSELLQEFATGITPDVDAATQRRFDDGHRFEALARPLAEKIIGKKLYPIIGSEGKLSASFDGLTSDDSVAFEHKTLNDSLRNCMAEYGAENLPEQYRAQMEQQLIVSGADKCLFVASKWDDGDTLEEIRHCWYSSDHVMRQRIIAGWEQFDKDLEEYKRKLAAGEIELNKPAPKAESIIALPSVFVQATGMVTASNLDEFKEAATSFIAKIKTELTTDQDFADAEATVKFCKDAESNLESTKASVLAQMSTVDEVVRTLDHIAAQLRDKRLMLDKLVKSEKEARKLAIVIKAGNDFTAHVQSLEAETQPIRLNVVRPDFAGAIKGLKSLSSMQEKVDTALRDGKYAAEQVAKDVRAKLGWCKDHAAGMSFLFPDLQQIISKPTDDFRLTINFRINEHKVSEERKEAEMRAKIETEAKAKAEREAAENLAQEEERRYGKIEFVQRHNRMDVPLDVLIGGVCVGHISKKGIGFSFYANDVDPTEPTKTLAECKASMRASDLAIIAAEVRAKIEAEQNTQAKVAVNTKDGAQPAVQTEPAAPVAGFNQETRARASRAEILEVLSENFGLTEEMMLDWIIAEFAGDIQFANRKVA